MKRKYAAPNWKVGDIVYFKWDSSYWWAEMELVGETSRSWLVIAKNSSAYMKDPTHWRWPSYCEKLPKCGYSEDDHWQAGTRMSKELNAWTLTHRKKIIQELEYSREHGYNPVLLRDLAQTLGLTEIVAQYPTEDANVKAESNIAPAVEDANRQ